MINREKEREKERDKGEKKGSKWYLTAIKYKKNRSHRERGGKLGHTVLIIDAESVCHWIDLLIIEIELIRVGIQILILQAGLNKNTVTCTQRGT